MTSSFSSGLRSPSSEVEITVSARKLRDRDLTSKSDPVCVLEMSDTKSGRLLEVGRTEQVKNSHDPDWVTKFKVKYMFELRQVLTFTIYDWDKKTPKTKDQDFLGCAEIALGELFSAQGTKVELPLKSKKHKKAAGTIMIVTDEVSSSKEFVELQFSAKKLDKMDTFGKSDPFLVFHRHNDDDSSSVVHQTEMIKNTLNPTWRRFQLPVRMLCRGDYDRKIKIECFDWDNNGTHDYIGEFETNLRTLILGPGAENTYNVINHKKSKKKGYKNSGTVRVDFARIGIEPSFLDFIRGGVQLHFTVAIDFTASNGAPSNPSSLHHVSAPGSDNQYTLAIKGVGEVVQDYDYDKMFPALGFGAKIPPNFETSFEFFLNGHPSNPYCAGIQGLLDAYYHTVNTVQLYGPTNFSPVVNHVSRIAEGFKDARHYFILLILTDGAITDLQEAKRAIIHASKLPVSIIIVGVGNANFDAMEELDADEGGLRSGHDTAQRDIVQFVEFRKFLVDGKSFESAKHQLTEEVLAEIPNQLVQYMKYNNVQPH